MEIGSNGKGFYCGGVLISDRYVLTAAHCVNGKDIPSTWRLTGVRLGEYNTDTDIDCLADGPRGTLESAIEAGYCADPPVDLAIADRTVHELYNPNSRNQQNDIALLRLERSVQFTDYIKPVCLPDATEQTKSFVGKSLYVAGWGKTESRSESPIKLKLEVPVVTRSACSNVYAGVSVQIGSGQLCAGGERGRDSCRGDSGGPLMAIDRESGQVANWIVAGIVSFGPSPCGMQGWPGVYTKVGDYVDWIQSKMRA
ncbi:CLIP domain-containing serine protease 2-like [Ctenocephalides felis]|uniref:CLIP domain-containing serine protease 2-like n=1 Tax=Ctenocephalides felis TaxID=7515 RepID=UPI000E6E4D38|nr:CLIP domain-containing serine protease 2-like [Ctenocephalides felis]